MSCLWMGNLESYMDEKFVLRAFATMGELVVNVRIIPNKMNCGAAGYCFVELPDEATAERCLQKVNGKLVPGATPPKRFKLNRAYGKQEHNRHSQPFPYDQNQYYQQYSNPNYYSICGYDQNVHYSSFDYSNQTCGDIKDDDRLEEPSVNLDVMAMNRQFMENSEELYDALIECHWPALDLPDSPE